MYKKLPFFVSSHDLKEILEYSLNLPYFCKHENHEKIYKSAGLSYMKNSKSPDFDVIDDLENDRANLGADNFVLKENIPTSILEIINKVSLGFGTSKVRFSKLFKGIIIPWHIDYNCENITRVHLPIITNTKCFYFYKHDGKIVPGKFEVGKFYALNTTYEHCVKNNGEEDRIHLIINVNTSFENYMNKINQI